jgi:hypothetical protein
VQGHRAVTSTLVVVGQCQPRDHVASKAGDKEVVQDKGKDKTKTVSGKLKVLQNEFYFYLFSYTFYFYLFKRILT